jgi:hypothetical protein
LKIAIHQPQYFPYPGFFHKLSLSDAYVIMDDVQYDKRFTNRNKIISPQGPMWISVPINKSQKFLPNNEVEINNDLPWAEVHWKRIQSSYNRTEFFHLYKGYLEQLYGRHWLKLFDLNFETLKQVISWLGIKIDIIKESELHINSKSTQRLVDVCNAVGADTYVAGSGSKNYMEEQIFNRNNVKVLYQNYVPTPYKQYLSKEFIPNLSIIDMLANKGQESLAIVKGETSVPLLTHS